MYNIYIYIHMCSVYICLYYSVHNIFNHFLSVPSPDHLIFHFFLQLKQKNSRISAISLSPHLTGWSRGVPCSWMMLIIIFNIIYNYIYIILINIIYLHTYVWKNIEESNPPTNHRPNRRWASAALNFSAPPASQRPVMRAPAAEFPAMRQCNVWFVDDVYN